MSIRLTLRATPLVVALAGCSPAIRSTTFLSELPPPRPSDHPVRVFYTKLPVCPYDEIGLVSAGRPSPFVPMQEVKAALLSQARRMGGDAVLDVDERSEVVGGGETVETRKVLRGTVVRFTDPSCVEPPAQVAEAPGRDG